MWLTQAQALCEILIVAWDKWIKIIVRACAAGLFGLFFNVPCLLATPSRVVSLVPSFTREICELGALDILVGVTSFRPECAAEKQVVGNLTGINVEQVIALEPDLVIASKDSNPKKLVLKLKSLGMNVVVFGEQQDFNGIVDTFLRLGRILGRESRARKIVDRVRLEVKTISLRSQGKKHIRVFWQLGSSPLVTASNRTFIGNLTRIAGGVNIFGDLQDRYPRVNREEVIMRDPDVIIVVKNMGCSTRDTCANEWAHIDGLSAAIGGRIYTLDPDIVCQPTPLRFVKALDVVSRMIQGDAHGE